LSFLPIEFFGTREEEKSRSENQEQGDIDGAREVVRCVSKKSGRRRYIVVTEL
jgi:hypothetical protein